MNFLLAYTLTPTTGKSLKVISSNFRGEGGGGEWLELALLPIIFTVSLTTNVYKFIEM